MSPLNCSGSPGAFHSLWPQLRLGGSLVLVGAVFPSESDFTGHGPNRPPQSDDSRYPQLRTTTLVAGVEFLQQTQNTYPFEKIVSRWFQPAADQRCSRRRDRSCEHTRGGKAVNLH